MASQRWYFVGVVAASSITAAVGLAWLAAKSGPRITSNEEDKPHQAAKEYVFLGRLIDYIFQGDELEALKLIRSAPQVAKARRRADGICAAAVAAQRSQTAILEALLQAGSDINCVDASGHTALSFAAAGGHVKCVRLLLAAGATPDKQSSAAGHSALHLAAAYGHAAVLRAMLMHDCCHARMDQQSNRGQTALMLAAAAGHLTAVRELLLAGANCHMHDAAGLTALHHAVLGGQAAVVAALLAAACGHAHSAPSDSHYRTPLPTAPTPLALAAANGDADIFMLLLHTGADPLQRTASPLAAYQPVWTTPLHLAAGGGALCPHARTTSTYGRTNNAWCIIMSHTCSGCAGMAGRSCRRLCWGTWHLA